jgi:integral membrane protein (TIGR01906 family)
MTAKDIFLRFAFAVLIFAAAVLLCCYQMARLSVDAPLMHRQFIKYSKTEYSSEQYQIFAEDITGYLSGEKQALEMALPNGDALLSQREILHMQDVKNLVMLGLAFFWPVLAILLMFFALFLLDRKNIISISAETAETSFLIGVGLFIAFLAAILIAYFVNFDGLFEKFHELLFTNDLWLLNEKEDILLKLMPEAFFESYGKLLLKRIFPVALCLVMGCFAVMFKGKKSDAK